MKVIDDLIEEYAPKHTEFQVDMLGQKIRFRVIKDYKEYAAIKAGSAMFAKNIIGSMQTPPTSSVLPAWQEYLTDDPQTLGWVNTLAETCLEPDAGHLDFLKIQAKMPVVFEMVKDQFSAYQLRMQEANEAGEIEHSKND